MPDDRGATRTVEAPAAGDIAEAAGRLAPHLAQTPLIESPALGPGVELKLETLNPTGSFKVRGALSALSRVAPGERVVTASTGNHALGVAWAAGRLGAKATVVCPETTSPAKLAALGRAEIDLVLHGTSADEAEVHALALAASGMRYVSAYNDPDVIAGQGTLVAELAARDGEQLTIVTPVGGGGLAAGVGLAASGLGEARVVGVQSEASHAMRAALDAGRIVKVDERPSLADGLAGNLEPGSITFELVRRHVDDVVLVTEDEIAGAIRRLATEHGLVVEGAGAAGVAALVSGRIGSRSGRTVIVVTGRNIAPSLLAQVLEAA
jgi:threonine dehydratase